MFISAYKDCLLCGSKTFRKTRTKEHIWPRWLSKELGFKEYLFRRSIRDVLGYRLLRARDKTRKTIGFGATVPLCYNCNSSVLGAFENKFAKPTLTPLVLGKPTLLDQTQQTIIATWVTKIAILVSMMDPEHDVMAFTDEERTSFINTVMPLPNTWVWIGEFTAPDGLPRDITLSHYQLISPNNETPKLNVTTNTLGCFMFQFLAARWDEPSPILEGRQRWHVRRLNKVWGPVSRQIWPIREESVQWPPEQVLLDEVFPAFADRWGGDTRVHRK